MTDAMRELLDDLMGQERDVPLVERTNKSLTFSDPAICKYSLAGLCPYRLFTNTKSFLGACKYDIHPGELRYEPMEEEWAKLSDEEKERYGYERELHGVLSHLVKDMDRHIERQWERANKENQPRPIPAADKERLETLKDQQMEALVKSEKAAEVGDVDESMKFAEEAEAYGEEHATLEKTLTQVERTMAVCNTCGVFINSTDNDARKHEHLQGKQYLGWLEIRAKLKELSELFKAREAAGTSHRPAEKEREKERERDHREREREGRSRDRDRNGRDWEREHRDRDRRRRSRSAEWHRSGRSDRRNEDDRRRSRERDTRYR